MVDSLTFPRDPSRRWNVVPHAGGPIRFLHDGINPQRPRVLIELEEEAKDIFDGARE